MTGTGANTITAEAREMGSVEEKRGYVRVGGGKDSMEGQWCQGTPLTEGGGGVPRQRG